MMFDQTTWAIANSMPTKCIQTDYKKAIGEVLFEIVMNMSYIRSICNSYECALPEDICLNEIFEQFVHKYMKENNDVGAYSLPSKAVSFN